MVDGDTVDIVDDVRGRTPHQAARNRHTRDQEIGLHSRMLGTASHPVRHRHLLVSASRSSSTPHRARTTAMGGRWRTSTKPMAGITPLRRTSALRTTSPPGIPKSQQQNTKRGMPSVAYGDRRATATPNPFPIAVALSGRRVPAGPKSHIDTDSCYERDSGLSVKHLKPSCRRVRAADAPPVLMHVEYEHAAVTDRV